MTEGQSGGKDRQASFPTKRPLEKLVKKRNPHRQDSSVAAWSPYCRCGSSRPFRDCSWKRHSLAEAREPTSLARRCWSSGGVRHRPALSPKWHGPTRVVQHHLTGPPCGSQAPLPSFQSSGRPGFPVRVGCSRTVMVPRWVLVPLVFQRPSFEDRLSSLDFRSSLRPNASQDSPSKPLFAGDKASLRESLSAAGEPSCVERVNPSWRTKSDGNWCLSSLLRRGLSRGPWMFPFDLLADTKKGQVCLKPKKIDFPKFTLYPPHLQTIVDNGTRVKTPHIRRCKSTQAKSC